MPAPAATSLARLVQPTRWPAVRVPAMTRPRLCFLACLGLCMAVDLCVARAVLPNSDSVQAYNEMLAVRSGNLLLHGWVLATDNQLLVDLPPMVLASLVLGKGPQLIFIVPLLVFWSMLAAVLMLVRTTLADPSSRLVGCYAVLLLLGTPYDLPSNFFFWSNFHVATVALCLCCILLIGPALSGRRFARSRLLPFTVLALALAFSDPMADGLLLGPLVLLVVARAWLYGSCRTDEWLVAGCALAGLGAGAGAAALLTRSGVAFTTLASVTLAFVPTASDLVANLRALLDGVQVLFNARPTPVDTSALHMQAAALRQVTACAAAGLCLAVLWRAPRDPRGGVAQLLLAGSLCLATLAGLSATFSSAIGTGLGYPGAAVRFAVPIFVFLCAAATLEGRCWARCRGQPWAAWLVAAGICVAGVRAADAVIAGVQAARSAPGVTRSPHAVLARWLQAHRLTYGVGDYWDTQLTEALSGGAVHADAMGNAAGRLHFFGWATDVSRHGRLAPQFAIVTPFDVFKVDMPAVTATYGAPVEVTRVAGQFLVARLATPAKLRSAQAAP